MNAEPDEGGRETFASFARELAVAARQETLARFGRNGAVDDKNKGGAHDPVTEADRAAELAMRERIAARYPDHGIRGEEFGATPGSGRYCWSLDPIDGTRSFICGLPTWVTLIALLDGDEPVLGVIDAPCLGETYVGTGEAAMLERNGSSAKIEASGRTALGEARLSTTDPYLFTGPRAEAFEQLRSSAQTVRFGHDGYAYARLAAGTLDLVIECGLKPHDYDALIPVVRGAGGVIGDWSGGSDFATGDVIAAATPELYEAAVAIMRTVA